MKISSAGSPRILFVATESYTIEAFLLPFAALLRESGFFVGAAANGAAGWHDCQSAFDQVWNVNWTRNPLQLIRLLSSWRQIRRVVVEGNFDMIHVHTPIAAFITRWAVRRLRRTRGLVTIYTAHGFHFHSLGNWFMNWTYLMLEKLAGRWTDYLIVINEEDRLAALEHGIVPEPRVRYMPGIGVDLDYYSNSYPCEEAGEFRSSRGIEHAVPVVLVIGDLIRRKRPHDVVEALALLKNKRTCLAFAGQDLLHQEIGKLVAKRGLVDRVFMLGQLDNVRPAILASTVVVHASQQEGLPRAIMESLSMGVPVICTDVRGSREIVDENCGIVVPVGDTRALAAAIDSILEDPVRLKEMGRRGREKMSRFALSRVLEMHSSLYEECLLSTKVPVRLQPKTERGV